MAESRKPSKPPASRGRLPESAPPVARPPESTGKPVAKRAAVPVGKPVSSVASSFEVAEEQSSASAYAHRRRSTPLGVWLGMGGVLILVAAVVGYLVMNFGAGDKAQTKDEDKNALAVVGSSSDDVGEEGDDPKDGAADDGAAQDGDAAGPADDGKPAVDADKADDARAAKPNDEKSSDERPSDERPSDEKPSDKKSSGEKSGDNRTDNKKPSGKEPGSTKPPKRAAGRLSKYRTIHEVPKSETPPALETAITEAITLAEGGKFDKLLSDFIDPQETSVPRRRGQPRSPQDLTGRSEALTLAALKALGSRKPHLFDEGRVAVFSLSDRTLPTFVKREGKWYLSTGRVVDISKRFRPIFGVDRLTYQLDRLNPGKKAISAKGAQPGGAQGEFVSRLLAMGAEVAVNGPDDQIRVAVLLSPRYTGGNEGLGILKKLTNLEVLIFDATSGFTVDGLIDLDPIHSLRYVEFQNISNAQTITVHFINMERLETLRLDAVVTDQDLGHLTKLFELKYLAISSKEISDEGLEQLDVLPQLEVLSIDKHQGGVTSEGAERMRQLIPRLWIDW